MLAVVGLLTGSSAGSVIIKINIGNDDDLLTTTFTLVVRCQKNGSEQSRESRLFP